jgi:hypothetical protein
MASTDIVESLLRELILEVRTLRCAVERHGRPSKLSRSDRITLERLLPAIQILFPDQQLFTAGEVMAHPAPGFRVVRGRLSAKSLGRLLTRADGVGIAGFKVSVISTERNISLYRVEPA